MRTTILIAASALALTACGKGDGADAYGNFEATEVVVAAQTSGQVLQFTPQEGAQLTAGAQVVTIDTTQLALERDQVLAQRSAGGAQVNEASSQVGVLETQRAIAQRNYERTKRLFAQQAATAQQLYQAERDYRVLDEQIRAAQAQKQSVGLNVAATDARLAQIRDRIAKSRVTNPVAGTVLATYTRAGEVVQVGQPLYRIANLDTLELRAYVTEGQLPAVKLGRVVQVNVDRGGSRISLPGVVSWVASKAEFTPTPIQTRDERADLVYAIKVRVANRDGALKIGMPADITLTGAPLVAPPSDTSLSKKVGSRD